MVRSTRRILTALALLLGALLGACTSMPWSDSDRSRSEPAADRSAGIERILSRGEIRVALTGDQPPFNMTTKQGELIGLEVALANALAENMGVKARFVVRPFPELLPTLERGEVDLVMSGLTITPRRNMRVAFVGPYFISGKSMLTKPRVLDSNPDPRKLNRASFRVAALRDSTSERFVERVLPEATLVRVDRLDDGIGQVAADRVDALVADYETCALAALRRPESGLVYLRKPFTVEPIGIAMPPDDPLLVNLIGNYLVALENTGMLKRAWSYWFENPDWLKSIR